MQGVTKRGHVKVALVGFDIMLMLRRYILSNIEHFSGLRRGDRIWQLGFGGGFKCNSAVWRARRNVKDSHQCWE